MKPICSRFFSAGAELEAPCRSGAEAGRAKGLVLEPALRLPGCVCRTLCLVSPAFQQQPGSLCRGGGREYGGIGGALPTQGTMAGTAALPSLHIAFPGKDPTGPAQVMCADLVSITVTKGWASLKGLGPRHSPQRRRAQPVTRGRESKHMLGSESTLTKPSKTMTND